MLYLQFTALGQSVAPNATVQPNTGGMLTAQVKEKKPHIKKPLNAFMLFMKQKRADVIKECTLKESAAINQILGKMVRDCLIACTVIIVCCIVACIG